MSRFSDTLSTNTLSSSTSVSTLGTTAKASNSVATFPTEQVEQPTQDPASSALSSSTKAGIGVGVTFGVSLAGLLIYFLVHRLRRQARRDITHTSTSTEAPLGSRRFEKPELMGEDARKEMDAAERRKAELPGNGTSMELEATP